MNPNSEHTSRPEPKTEKDKALEKIAAFRSEVISRLKSKKPLYLPHQRQNGDDLLFRAAYWKVLEKFCTEEGLDPNSISFTEDDSSFFDIYGQSFSIEYDGRVAGLFPKETKPVTHYQADLLRGSRALGMDVSQEEFEEAPAVRPSDHGPLASYDERTVQEKVSQLQSETAGKKVVVLTQSGSNIDKRYTDDQLVELANTIKSSQPDAYVIVLSDKPLLRVAINEAKQKLDGKKRVGFPVAIEVTLSEHYTPEQVQKFSDELDGSIVANEENKIDRVIETDDINEVLACLRIAEEGVFTDGYWMHLGASQHISKMYALFTLFKPELWAPISVTAVESAALVPVDPYVQGIDSITYHQSEEYENESKDEDEYGIEKKDMEKMLQVIRDSPKR